MYVPPSSVMKIIDGRHSGLTDSDALFPHVTNGTFRSDHRAVYVDAGWPIAGKPAKKSTADSVR